MLTGSHFLVEKSPDGTDEEVTKVLLGALWICECCKDVIVIEFQDRYSRISQSVKCGLTIERRIDEEGSKVGRRKVYMLLKERYQ